MQLYALPTLRGRLHRTWAPEEFVDRLAPIDSPLRLGALLTPLNGAVFRRREGDQRLVFVPQRVNGDTWRLVLVDVIDRRTGDQQAGRYRRLLSKTREARQDYLAQIEQGSLERVPGTTSITSVRILEPIPDELYAWTQPGKTLEDLELVVDPSLPDTITFHAFDPSQAALLDGPLRTAGPRFLTGRAGSSKSTLLHHQFARYAMFAIENGHDGHPHFVTRSQHLLEDARRRVEAILLEEHGLVHLAPESVPAVRGWMSTTSKLLHQLVLDAGERHAEWDPAGHISTARFRELYRNERRSGLSIDVDFAGSTFRDFGTRRRIHWTTAWFVIRALILGYHPAEILDPEMYEELPEGDRLVTSEQFVQVYERIYEPWYRCLLEDGGYWDDQWLARAAIRHPHNGQRITALVCDEAQDLSRVELLALLGTSELLSYDLGRQRLACLPFVFAGDESQTVDLTGFRWASITSGFYELTGAAFGEAESLTIDDDQLAINYRSAFAIVEIANAIQRRRRERFAELSAEAQQAFRAPTGVPMSLVDRAQVPRLRLIETLSVSNVILPCDEGAEHEMVRADPLLTEAFRLRHAEWVDAGVGTAPVYTAQALKGLEFEDVVLYGWGEVLLDGARPELARRIDHARWYVAVTRAVERLVVIESAAGRRLWDDLGLAGDILTDDGLAEVEDLDTRHRASAEETRQLGQRAHRADQMFLAAQMFTSLGDERDAKEANAYGARFERDHERAAARFLELGLHDQAADDLWTGRLWPRLASLTVDRPSVVVARMMCHPEDAGAVEAGIDALARCREEHAIAGEPLDLVGEVAGVAHRALIEALATAPRLLDTLASEPRLTKGQRTGLADLVARTVAAEPEMDALVDAVTAAYETSPRRVLLRWIAARDHLGAVGRQSLVDALVRSDPETGHLLADELGITIERPRASPSPKPSPMSSPGPRSSPGPKSRPKPRPKPVSAPESTPSPPRPRARPPVRAAPVRGGGPAPGDPWRGARGAEGWTLSESRSTLFRKRDRATLASLVGDELAAPFVARALQIRADGGAVWVDAQGHTTILVGGRLTFLGVLPGHADAEASPGTAARTAVRPAASTAEPASPKRKARGSSVRPRRHGVAWTAADEAALRTGWQAGRTVEELAGDLERSATAVADRLRVVADVPWLLAAPTLPRRGQPVGSQGLPSWVDTAQRRRVELTIVVGLDGRYPVACSVGARGGITVGHASATASGTYRQQQKVRCPSATGLNQQVEALWDGAGTMGDADVLDLTMDGPRAIAPVRPVVSAKTRKITARNLADFGNEIGYDFTGWTPLEVAEQVVAGHYPLPAGWEIGPATLRAIENGGFPEAS